MAPCRSADRACVHTLSSFMNRFRSLSTSSRSTKLAGQRCCLFYHARRLTVVCLDDAVEDLGTRARVASPRIVQRGIVRGRHDCGGRGIEDKMLKNEDISELKGPQELG